MTAVVFVNIAWMREYKGETAADPVHRGNFKHLKDRSAVAHEQWNFRSKYGRVYGYVPKSIGINITRLGASPRDAQLDGVVVAFIARDPHTRQLKVVGWYENATVARKAVFGVRFSRTEVTTPVIANQSDAHLLPVIERDIIVPTAQREPGGVGQSPVWYAKNHPQIVQQVLQRVRGETAGRRRKRNKSAGSRGSRAPRNPDLATRLAVERVAMERAERYFGNTEDVSRACLGWDLEARVGDRKYLIEAKGLSGSKINFELTPNELTQMRAHKSDYILFVVTSALTKNPLSTIFRYHVSGKNKGCWVSECGKKLVLKE